MIGRYGSANSYIAIDDDGRITAAGEGDFAPEQIALLPRTNPGPAEGAGGYEIWRADRETLGAGDKPMQLVDETSGAEYLFLFREGSSIDFYSLGHNFHTGTPTYLFIFQVSDQPSNDPEKWRIYDWIRDFGA